jgi:hypothetical protein
MPSTIRQFFHRLRPWHGGPVMVLIGTALVGVGLLQTTTATQTVLCPTDTTLISKFNFVGQSYVFEKPHGNEDVVHITNGTGTGGDWLSTMAVSAIVVKGGPAAVLTLIDPPQSAGHFTGDNLPDVGSGNTPSISNVQFCAPVSNGTTTRPTTTTSATTTSTATTTVPPTTTTTATTIVPSTTSGSTTTTSTTVPSTTATPPTTTLNYVTSTSVIVLSEGAEVEGATLARTGSPSVPMLVFGFVLMMMGATLTIVGRAKERRRI